MIEDKHYPKSIFDQDLETIRKMNLSDDLKAEKGEALAFVFFNQNNENMIDRFAIADFRNTILQNK
jgi:hypothetical protein